MFSTFFLFFPYICNLHLPTRHHQVFACLSFLVSLFRFFPVLKLYVKKKEIIRYFLLLSFFFCSRFFAFFFFCTNIYLYHHYHYHHCLGMLERSCIASYVGIYVRIAFKIWFTCVCMKYHRHPFFCHVFGGLYFLPLSLSLRFSFSFFFLLTLIRFFCPFDRTYTYFFFFRAKDM